MAENKQPPVEDADIVEDVIEKKPEGTPNLPVAVMQEAKNPEESESSPVVAPDHQLILAQNEREQEEQKRKQEDIRRQAGALIQVRPGFMTVPPSSGGETEPEIPFTAPPLGAMDMASETAAPTGVSREENEQCLQAIARLYDLPELSGKEHLSHLALVDKGPAPLAPASLLVSTSSNVLNLAKGKVEFQNDMPVNPADALEGAILALNDVASYPSGVYLHGNDRDRYMLMLAAEKVGMKVANPVTVSEDVRTEVESQWAAHMASLPPANDPVSAKVQEMADAAESMTAPKPPEGTPERDIYGRVEPWFTPRQFAPAT